MIIGVDPHKSTHTATAVDAATNTAVASVRVAASAAGYRRLLGWAEQFGERRWAVENAKGLGCHLAQWLVAHGETVLDASTAATARVRELSRGGRRKNDVIDASAAASVAAYQGDAAPVGADDDTVVFALLEERRASLAAQRVRSVNQLHALLRDLVAGGAPTALKADGAATQHPPDHWRRARPKTAGVGPRARDPRPRHRAEVDHPAHGRGARGPPEPAARHRRCRPDSGSAPHRPLRPGLTVPDRGRVRQLRRNRSRGGIQRRTDPPPALPQRRPQAELGAAPRRGDPGEWREGTSPFRSVRTVRDSLSSYGSHSSALG